MMRRLLLLVLLLASPGLLYAAGRPGGDYWLEASLSPAPLWVQAQAVYRLRFYQAVDVRDLQLHAPQAAQAELRALGAGRVLDEDLGGRRYRVTERSYALIPFASGPLALQGGYATGSLPDLAAGSPDARRELRLPAGDRTLQVLPIPQQMAGQPWLPARALEFAEAWASDLAAAQQGATLVRTLRIQATGVDAAQIPPYSFAVDGFSVHAEAARLENRSEGDWNVGVREQSYRLVPLRAGRLQLPELRLTWWNSAAGQPETARIAARTLQVAGTALPEPELPVIAAASVPRPAQPVVQADWGPLLFVAALPAAWLLWLSWRRRASWRDLRAACLRDDAPAAQQALLHWAAGIWRAQPPRTLGELTGRLDDEAAQAVRRLERRLYGPPGAAWQGRTLLDTLGRHQRTRLAAAPALPTLYPD